MDAYTVISGLGADDYIAFPEDDLKAGMTCTTYSEADFTPSGEASQTYDMGGIPMEEPIEEFYDDSAVVEFEADGRRISLESDEGGGRKRFYEGQRVGVLYDPDDPTCFRLEGRSTTRLVGNIFLTVGLGCFAIGVIVGWIVNGPGARR